MLAITCNHNATISVPQVIFCQHDAGLNLMVAHFLFSIPCTNPSTSASLLNETSSSVPADVNTRWFGNWRNRHMPRNCGVRQAIRASLGAPCQKWRACGMREHQLGDLPKLLAFAGKESGSHRRGAGQSAGARHRGFVSEERPQDLGAEPKGRAVQNRQVLFPELHGKARHPDGTRGNVLLMLTPRKKFAAELDGKCAVKAGWPCAGQRRLICANMSEANKAIDDILIAKSFGMAGAKIVTQEFLEGVEISLHMIVTAKRQK